MVTLNLTRVINCLVACIGKLNHLVGERLLVEINEVFLKTWRERYRWPRYKSRIFSEKRIFELEELVRRNILDKGSKTVKDALAEIVRWKTGGRFQALNYFLANDEKEVKKKTDEVLELLRREPKKVVEPMKRLTSLKGVRIAVASAFLRFMDPIEHKYGIIDKNVARLLNDQGITHFTLRSQDDYIKYNSKNIEEYQNFSNWLREKTTSLARTTYKDVYGNERNFTPVDVEMAIFTYKTQCK